MSFLACAAEFNPPRRLETLEIFVVDAAPHGLSRAIICDFLGSFEGLRHLFVSEPEKPGPLLFWDAVACRQPALRAFVYQQRLSSFDRHSFRPEQVVPSISVCNVEMFQVPCAYFKPKRCHLDLEFLGLPCRPLLLVRKGGGGPARYPATSS